MNTAEGCLVVSLNLSGAETTQRLEVCQAAFDNAQKIGIDEIRLQPAFMERPPPDIEQAVQALLRGKHPRWGRVKIVGPSPTAIDTSLRACPYLKSVVLFKAGRMLVGVADAADALDLIITADRWATLRPKLIGILGSDLRARIDEISGC